MKVQPTLSTLSPAPGRADRGPTVEDWLAQVSLRLAGVIGGTGRVGSGELLCPLRSLADDVMKVLLRDTAGRPVAVLHCSPPEFPGTVADAVSRALAAQRALGPELGRVVLTPLAEGSALGSSYAVVPYCRPLRQSGLIGWVVRARVGRRLLDWLRRVTESTAAAPATGTDDEVVAALTHLEGWGEACPQLRSAAGAALVRLLEGSWVPRRVLMHGDFWLGNVLLREADAGGPSRAWHQRLVVIDWPGSRPDGFAFFDLICLARSTRLTPARLRAEVAAHAALLGCDPADARFYLALALAALAAHLGHFPVAEYNRMASLSLRTLDRVIA